MQNKILGISVPKKASSYFYSSCNYGCDSKLKVGARSFNFTFLAFIFSSVDPNSVVKGDFIIFEGIIFLFPLSCTGLFAAGGILSQTCFHINNNMIRINCDFSQVNSWILTGFFFDVFLSL